MSNTSEAQSFALIGEEGTSKGVRRINAITGQIMQIEDEKRSAGFEK